MKNSNTIRISLAGEESHSRHAEQQWNRILEPKALLRGLPGLLAVLSSIALVLFCLSPLGLAQNGQGRSFFVQDLGHRCLDFGAQAAWAVGVPVYTYSCNGSVAQQVTVTELDASHDVQLSVNASSGYYSSQQLFCIGVRGGVVAVDQPLELQTCNQGWAQRFALDGDAILMGLPYPGPQALAVSRALAIRPQLSSTALRTPLVVEPREVSDVEYFRFNAVDKSGAYPTTGFVLVSSESELDAALSLGWGTVIEVNPKTDLVLLNPGKHIHAGTTLRGDRKYTLQGPIIHGCTNAPTNPKLENSLFEITENDVRITGLRLHGPLSDSLCKQDSKPPLWGAVLVCSPAVPPPGQSFACGAVPRVLIDHLDISYFTYTAVATFGLNNNESDYTTCPCPALGSAMNTPPRDTPVRIIGNSIHNNGGYGTNISRGAFVLNERNIFYRQGDAQNIASDGVGSSGFYAYDNFFLSDQYTTDAIDMHGSSCDWSNPGSSKGYCHWQGGLSGDVFDIGWNTFLQTHNLLVLQRGSPCRFTAVHDNISVLPNASDALLLDTIFPYLDKQPVSGNIYKAKDPTGDLAIGDFDGDGIDDVFVGTGGAWYYSSGGRSEWRFLNRMPEHASNLLFGDFDGDGRTDIIALHGTNIDISWGGMSPWQTINTTTLAFSDLAVGDFNGDGISDLFLATGAEWLYAPAGKNWTVFASSRYRTGDLRFGDFTHKGRTQALRVYQGQWQVAGLLLDWTNIGSSPVSSVAGLVVGDFDGDGFADVAHTQKGFWSSNWEYTTPAHGKQWVNLRSDSADIASYPIGRFNSDRTSDVLAWDNRRFSYAASGRNPLMPLSLQDMR